MKDLLLKENNTMILTSLLHSKKAVYVSALSKEINYTYSHLVKVLQEMERKNLVEFEKHGRMKVIELTDKGKKVAESIEKIKELL